MYVDESTMRISGKIIYKLKSKKTWIELN